MFVRPKFRFTVRRVVVTDVNIDGILCVASHHTNDQWVGGMEDVGDQSATIAPSGFLVHVHAIQ